MLHNIVALLCIRLSINILYNIVDNIMCNIDVNIDVYYTILYYIVQYWFVSLAHGQPLFVKHQTSSKSTHSHFIFQYACHGWLWHDERKPCCEQGYGGVLQCRACGGVLAPSVLKQFWEQTGLLRPATLAE